MGWIVSDHVAETAAFRATLSQFSNKAVPE